MIDRWSTFSHPKIIEALQKKFIPVAIDQFNQRQQKDAEGEFWRKIAKQVDYERFNPTTQGLYIATASGRLIGFHNHRGVEPTWELMKDCLRKYTVERDVALLDGAKLDPYFVARVPDGALVVRSHGKVLGGYATPRSVWEALIQKAVSRDNVWILKEEREALRRSTFPKSLAMRLARFHLVDSTRGEPVFWRHDEVRELEITLDKEGTIRGRVVLVRKNGKSGYEADLLGELEHTNGRLSRFDLVAHGDYWGHGRYTRNPPEGRFPFALSFHLTDQKSVYDQVPPQGTKGGAKRYVSPAL